MAQNSTTRRDALKLLGTGAALAAVGTGTASAQPDGRADFEFSSMVGNDLTGTDGAIRGIEAGGAPWVIDSAEAKLDDGTLKVEVEGLVLDPAVVPDPKGGTNPIGEFRAILSCLTPMGDDYAVMNVRTDTAPASVEGDFEIEETVDMPDSCLAPLVFVAGAAEILGSDLWFAVTGV